MVRRYTNDEIQEILRSKPPVFIPDNGIDPGVPGSVPAPNIGDALTQKVLSAAGTWITPGEAASGNLNAYTLISTTSAVSAGLQLNKAAVTTVAAISAGLQLIKADTTTVAAVSAGLSTRIDGKVSTGLGFPGTWTRVVVSSDGVVTSGSNVGGGSGVSNFTSLTDVPSSYVGYAGRSLIVNNNQTALEYFTPIDALNVKDFGAYGDDTTRLLTAVQASEYNARYGSFGLVATSGDENDWAAIQGAMLKAAYTGQQIYLPVGTYRVNKPLALKWTTTPSSSAAGYPLNTRIVGAGLRTIIKSYSIPAGRGSMEFLGESNPISVNMELAHLTIKQDPSCAYNSYCLRMGDAWCGFKGYRLNLEGAQALVLKTASSVSYANLCTNFEQCRFWTNYGYQWFANDDLATTFCVNNETGGAFWDNVKFTSCLFHGLVQPRAFVLDFDNCQFFVNPKRPIDSGYDFAINCYLYLGGATFTSCYFEDHKVAISAASFTADVRPIFIKNCHFSGVTNFPSGAPFVESAIRVFPSINGVVGTVMIEGCSFGDDLYLNGSIDVQGCTLIERGSYNITQPGKPITRNVAFTTGEWDNQDYNIGDGNISNRTSNYFVDRFKRIDVVNTSTTSIHTSGGILADISMSSPNMIASRPNNDGNTAAGFWGIGAVNTAASDNLIMGWSSTAYTTGGPVPWIENDNAHLYIPGTKRLRVGFGVNPLAYTDFKSTGIESPYGQFKAPFHLVNRYGTGTENANFWYTAYEDASGLNQLIIGNTGTTYTTGGGLPWIGNDQPFINTSFTKGLKVGFGTNPTSYHFNYNSLSAPGDVVAAGYLVSTSGLSVTGPSFLNGAITSNSTISVSGGIYSAVNGNYFNQVVLTNSSTGSTASSQVSVGCDNSTLDIISFSRSYPLPDQSWIYTSTNTPVILGTNSTARVSITTNGNVIVNNHFSTDNGVDKIQVTGSGRFTGKIYADNVKYGTGTPEGNLSGSVGDIFQRTDGGSGTTLYIKESGSGTTGWTAVAPGSSGGGGTFSGTIASGQVAIGTGTNAISGSSRLQWSVASGLSSNRAGSQNEMFGSQAGNNSVSGTQNTMVGRAAGSLLGTGGSNTIIGANAASSLGTGSQNTLIGNLVTSNGSFNGDGNTVIGQGAGGSMTTASVNTIIGSSAGGTLTTGFANIIIGTSSVAPSSNSSSMFIAGSSSYPISSVSFGKGYRNGSPTDYIIRGTNASGSNIAGANIIIAGGFGTGTGMGGAVIFQTAKGGASGTDENLLQTRLSVLGDGAVRWTGISPATTASNEPAVSSANTGTIYYNQDAQDFYASKNGGAYAPLGADNRVVALTDAATINTDANLGSIFTVTISGNRTMANPTNSIAGKRITYQIRQDNVGGRTITWDTNFRFSQDVPTPTLSTSGNLTDYIGFIYNGISSKWDCLAVSIGY